MGLDSLVVSSPPRRLVYARKGQFSPVNAGMKLDKPDRTMKASDCAAAARVRPTFGAAIPVQVAIVAQT